MNLHGWLINKAGVAGRPAAAAGFLRQIRRRALFSASHMMPSFARVSTFALCLTGALTAVFSASAQTAYYTNSGSEYAVVGTMPGDCTTDQVIDAGDHWIVIGRVWDVHHGIAPQHPLTFFGGRYRALDVAESKPAPDLTNLQAEPAHIFYDH